MERSRHRLHPAALMAMLGMAMAPVPSPMPDGKPTRRQHPKAQPTRKLQPPSHSKYTRHQGKKECARRLRQAERLAA
jgi:hypothetical protein